MPRQTAHTPTSTGTPGSKSDSNPLITTEGENVNLRPSRSRKDRPCDYCRRLKHTCRILVRGQACTNCKRAKRDCTFQQPPRLRHTINKAKRNDLPDDRAVLSLPENLNIGPSTRLPVLTQAQDPFIPLLSHSDIGQSSELFSLYATDSSRTERRSSLHSSLAAIFEVEDNTSDDSAYYASLDLESNDAEEHHYLGPGALMHLTLNADQNNSMDIHWLNLFNQPDNANLATDASGASLNSQPLDREGKQPLQLSYRQVGDPKKPVYFLKEPSKVYGLSNASYEAETAWKTAGEILLHNQAESGAGQRVGQQLINIFINSTLPALPMINKVRFQASIYAWQGAHPFPHALLVGILAHSAASVPALRNIWKDLWAMVLNLLDNEYRHPRLQTLQLAILDMWGRPNINPAGNHIAICRAIGAAQMLGLHKDSSHWRLPRWERSTRKRIWWLIYVADKWNSLTYGRPSNTPSEITIPLPSVYDNDDGGQSAEDLGPNMSFILMCRLTIILNTLLPILSDNNGETDKFTNNRQIILSAAMDLEELSKRQSADGSRDCIPDKRPGMASFILCHLCLSVRLASLSLDEVVAGLVFSLPFDSYPRAGSVSHHVIAVTTKVVEFLESLDIEQFNGLWTPWSSLQLTHAMSLGLRLLARLSSTNLDSVEFPKSTECYNLIDRFLTVLVTSETIWEVAGDALGKIRVLFSSMPDLEGLSDLKSKIGLGELPNVSESETAWSEWLSLLGMEWINNEELNTTLVQ